MIAVSAPDVGDGGSSAAFGIAAVITALAALIGAMSGLLSNLRGKREDRDDAMTDREKYLLDLMVKDHLEPDPKDNP